MASTPETPTIEETELEQSPSESSASTNVEAIVPSLPEVEQIVAPNRAPTEPDGQGGPSSRTGYLKTADDFLDEGIKAFDDRNFAEAGDFFRRALAIRIKYYGKSATECAPAYIGCGLAQLDFDNDGSIMAGVKQGESSKNLESVYNPLNIARSIVEKQLVESEVKVCIFDALREVASQEGELKCQKYEHIANQFFKKCMRSENDSKIEAIAYCEKAISTCQTRIKSLMDELDNSSAAAAGSTVSELNHESSSVPPVDPSILQKKAEINALTELSSNRARKGKRLLEVFSMRIMSIYKQYRGHLYGKIKVVDTIPSQHIYTRNREDSESIMPGDIALPTGPTQSILAYESFVIAVSLVYEYDSSLLDDEHISGRIEWCYWGINRGINRGYDTLFFEVVRGMFSWVILSYVVFSNAVEATLEVTLIKSDDEIPTNLYGKITACNSKFLDRSAVSVLFHKKLTEDIVVRHGQHIPLTRSLAAVPLDSSFTVEAELWDSLNNYEIAKGIAVFQPQLSGTFEQTISSEYSNITVKVTWC